MKNRKYIEEGKPNVVNCFDYKITLLLIHFEITKLITISGKNIKALECLKKAEPIPFVIIFIVLDTNDRAASLTQPILILLSYKSTAQVTRSYQIYDEVRVAGPTMCKGNLKQESHTSYSNALTSFTPSLHQCCHSLILTIFPYILQRKFGN